MKHKTIFIFAFAFLIGFGMKVNAQLCVPPKSSKIFVSVTGTNPYTLTAHIDTTSYSYEWVYAASASFLPFALASSGTKTYTTPYLTSTRYYAFEIFCGWGYSEFSCIIKLPPTSFCDTPSISASKTIICSSDTITLSSSITDECRLYQWQDSLLGDVSGATFSTLKILPTSSKTYRLKYTCAYGTTYSSWLRVSPRTVCDTPIVSISKTIGCTGDTLQLSAAGISPCTMVQWEDSLKGLIAGATKDTFKFVAATTRSTYRLKYTCPLGSVAYTKWISFTPYTCDSPIVSISAIGGCTGDTLKLSATGISHCTSLQWEDSLGGIITGAIDSIFITTASAVRNAYRLKTTCPSGSIYYSDWLGFTLYSTCDDSVWAGDINWDLSVDYLDLLDLGVAYGTRGIGRTSPTIRWLAQYAKNWSPFFLSTVNYKNADCNGDGVVNDDDTLAIYTNYSLVHSIGIITPKYPKIAGLPDLYFNLSGLSPHAGDVISIPIEFGTSSEPVPLIYGIAAQIFIDGVPPLASPMNLEFSPTWIGTPTYKLEMFYSPSSNQLNATYVRKDNNNNAGFGTIGMLTIQVPPTTPDNSMMHFHFLSAKVIDKFGNEIKGYNIIEDSILIMPSTGIRNVNSTANRFIVFPNPSNGKLTIKSIIPTSLRGTKQSINATLFDFLGRTILQTKLQFHNNESYLNIDAPKGIYILELQDEIGNRFRERIVVE